MKKSASFLRNVSLLILSTSIFLGSCSKDKDMGAPIAPFAGQFHVIDDTETYTIKIENKGGSNFHISEFGGFLNVPLKAVAEGNMLKIPSQTFKNPSGKSITVVGSGVLSTKNSKDDTITFQYTVSGFANYDGDFTGTRK